jgi:hypothetical protein
MINKSALVLAAALFAGMATNASAAAMDNDANTGLWSYIYYGPIAQLQQQGLPVSAAAAKYASQHRAVAPVATKRGNSVYLLEDTQGIVAPRQAAPAYNNSDFQSGNLW